MNPASHYNIRDDYQQRYEVNYCRHFKAQSKRKPLKQPFVYDIMGEVARQVSASFLVDVGCGNGYKISQYESAFPIIGVDYGRNIDFCKENYSFECIDFDLEQESYLDLNRAGGVAVCSDVIEHLLNPDLLTMKKWLDVGTCKAVVLSTPERDLTYNGEHIGPPDNVHHIREWNMMELDGYLRNLGLPIAVKGLTCDRDDCSTRVSVGGSYLYPNGYGRLPPFRTIFMVLSHLNIKLTDDKIRWAIQQNCL
jgi:hypothetical protein